MRGPIVFLREIVKGSYKNDISVVSARRRRFSRSININQAAFLGAPECRAIGEGARKDRRESQSPKVITKSASLLIGLDGWKDVGNKIEWSNGLGLVASASQDIKVPVFSDEEIGTGRHGAIGENVFSDRNGPRLALAPRCWCQGRQSSFSQFGPSLANDFR